MRYTYAKRRLLFTWNSCKCPVCVVGKSGSPRLEDILANGRSGAKLHTPLSNAGHWAELQGPAPGRVLGPIEVVKRNPEAKRCLDKKSKTSLKEEKQ